MAPQESLARATLGPLYINCCSNVIENLSLLTKLRTSTTNIILINCISLIKHKLYLPNYIAFLLTVSTHVSFAFKQYMISFWLRAWCSSRSKLNDTTTNWRTFVTTVTVENDALVTHTPNSRWGFGLEQSECWNVHPDLWFPFDTTNVLA